MKPIIIQEKTRGRLLAINAELQRMSAERDGLLTAILEANGVEDMTGYQVAPDFSQIIPPPEKPEQPKPKMPNGGKKK